MLSPQGFANAVYQTLRLRVGSGCHHAPVCSSWIWMILGSNWTFFSLPIKHRRFQVLNHTRDMGIGLELYPKRRDIGKVNPLVLISAFSHHHQMWVGTIWVMPLIPMALLRQVSWKHWEKFHQAIRLAGIPEREGFQCHDEPCGNSMYSSKLQSLLVDS